MLISNILNKWPCKSCGYILDLKENRRTPSNRDEAPEQKDPVRFISIQRSERVQKEDLLGAAKGIVSNQQR